MAYLIYFLTSRTREIEKSPTRIVAVLLQSDDDVQRHDPDGILAWEPEELFALQALSVLFDLNGLVRV